MAKKEKETTSKKKGRYFKDMKAELKKVVWPTPKQTANNALAVIVFALILAVIVFVLDVCFDALNKKGITPLQEKITSSYNATSGETTDGATTEGGAEAGSEENSEKDSTKVTVETNTESNE